MILYFNHLFTIKKQKKNKKRAKNTWINITPKKKVNMNDNFN